MGSEAENREAAQTGLVYRPDRDRAANEMGYRPRDGYPTDPRPKITEEKWVENKQVLYDWEAKS